jgi:hypothetical protein
MKKTLPAVVLSALAVLAFTGCEAATDEPGQPTRTQMTDESPSESPSESETPVESAPPANTLDPEGTARAMADGVATGDPAACDLMTANMQKVTVSVAAQFGVTEKDSTCVEYVSGLPAFMKEAGVTEPLKIESVTVDSQTDTEAVVTVAQTNGPATSSNSYRLVNTDGQWLVDSPMESSVQSQ